MKNKTIAVIGTVGLPAEYGGFETLVEQLVINLADKYSLKVYCSSKHYSKKSKEYLGAELIYLPFKANGKWSIFYDAVSIIHALFNSRILLVLGVSGAFMLPLIKNLTSKVIIVNIDGLEWKREKWGKLAQLYLKWQEKLAVKYSHCIISDNKGIQKYVKKSYRQSSILITYGGSHAEHFPLARNLMRKYNVEEKSYAFTVCRIEPENNIHLILEAFLRSNKRLIIVGNWDSSDYGVNLKLQYQKYESISIVDPIYDQKILNQLRSNCSLYVHGHSAGGTNPSLVEAMWLGLPVIAYDVNYNRYTTSGEALFFSSLDGLVSILKALPSKTELIRIGQKMREIAHEKYDWVRIAESYNSLFKSVT